MVSLTKPTAKSEGGRACETKKQKEKENENEGGWCAVVAEFLGHVAGYEVRFIVIN